MTTANDVLTNLAAAVAVIAIPKDDHGECVVTLTFTAQRDAKGVLIQGISLGWKSTKRSKPTTINQ